MDDATTGGVEGYEDKGVERWVDRGIGIGGTYFGGWSRSQGRKGKHMLGFVEGMYDGVD